MEPEIEWDAGSSNQQATQPEVQERFSVNDADVVQALDPDIIIGQGSEQLHQASIEVQQPVEE